MRAGQFVKGIFNGTTEAYQTLEVEKLLSTEEFDKLYNRKQKGVYLYINNEEGVLAKSTVTETSDGEFTGRKGLINHTVIVAFDTIIKRDGLTFTRTTPVNATLAERPDITALLDTAFPELKQPLSEVK